MVAALSKSIFEIFHRHLPGFVIGSYFISIQFYQSIDLSFLILLAGLLLLFITQPKLDYRLLKRGATVVASFLLFSTVLSSTIAEHGFVSRAMPLAQIPGLLVFLITVLFVREKSQIALIVWSFLLGVAIDTWQFFAASYAAGFVRSRELIFAASHPLYLAPNDVLMFTIFFPVIIWYGRHLKSNWGLLLMLAYTVLLIGLSELLLSRIALLAVIATFLLPVLLAKRWKILVGLLIVAIVSVSAIAYYDKALLSKLLVHDFDRIRLWVVACRMFMEAPWLGHGPGSFTVLYTHYLDQIGSAANYGSDVRHMGWAHSLFFESASEKGVVGLCAVFSYFAYLFMMTLKKLKSSGDGFDRAWGLSAILLLLAASVELSMLRIWSIYVLYLMLGLNAVFMRRESIRCE